MNILKRTSGILLTLIIALSAAVLPTAVSAKSIPIFKFNKKHLTVAAGSYKSFYIISKNGKYRINTNVNFKSSNKKVAQFKNEAVPYSAGWNYSTESENEPAIIRGYKPGKAVITAYEKGTNKKLGTMKVTVKKIKSTIKKKYKTTTIKYNPHRKDYVFTSLLVNNPKKGAVYTAKIDDTKIAKTVKGYKFKVNSVVTVQQKIEAQSLGKTKATIYEKLNGKNRKVGKLTIKTVYRNTADVLKMEERSDPMYWDDYQIPGYKFNIIEDVKNYYLYDFKESEYTITLKNTNADVLSLDEDGNATILKNPKEGEKYGVKVTITFTDGSEYKCKVKGPSIVDEL
ncbi:MAG: hypothetical protein IIU39_04900 [Ruminococcus sp.]|nr:hypothetical protein [Ruminococcus sp.]